MLITRREAGRRSRSRASKQEQEQQEQQRRAENVSIIITSRIFYLCPFPGRNPRFVIGVATHTSVVEKSNKVDSGRFISFIGPFSIRRTSPYPLRRAPATRNGQPAND